MKTEGWFKRKLEKFCREDHKFLAEMIKIDFAGKVMDILAERNMSIKDLARMTGISDKRMTDIMSGYMTINDMARLAIILGCKMHVVLKQRKGGKNDNKCKRKKNTKIRSRG